MDRGGVARVVKVFINIIIINAVVVKIHHHPRRRRGPARRLHWFPYDRVRVVNAVP